MRNIVWNAMTLAVLTMGVTCAATAQTAATQPSLTARMESAATPDRTSDATRAASSTAKPEIDGSVTQEIEALKNRIDQLENEVREEKARALADSADTAALKAAEKELVAGNGGAALSPAPGGSSSLHSAAPPLGAGESSSLQAATPAVPATPAPPEIGAQTTTKGDPFPGDWTWLNSNGHAVDSPMSTKYFTPEFRADANYTLDYNHPEDDSLGGSTETFRSDEWQLEQISIGGDIHINNVRGRILTMNGLFATTTVRNDGSPNRGQWDLGGAYKYVSEAWGGYHWNVAHGLNVDAGIFVSYIGLFSYYNFDNWTYQPSFVSSNTPWFFNGLRIQYFPTAKLKIEPWIINGWQSYARYGSKPGLGGQILWRPKPYLDFVWNNYGLGEDDSANLGRSRIHADYKGEEIPRLCRGGSSSLTFPGVHPRSSRCEPTKAHIKENLDGPIGESKSLR
ncbi:MAG: outer membrane beta-barrel protein, partial [Terracidiphilus sp.]